MSRSTENPSSRRVTGVQFPATDSGSRSTSAFGRGVVASALDGVDAAASAAASAERDWRAGYLPHFRALVASGLASADDAFRIADQGLTSVKQRMMWVDPESASETPLGSLQPARGDLGTVEVTGRGAPVEELALPVGGRLLSGGALDEQLDTWVTTGAIEPSTADSVREVAANPEWLSLPGRTLVALGAGAEVGPLGTFLGWGARVVAADLPRPHIWKRVLETVEQNAGTLIAPVRDGFSGSDPDHLGVDLLTDLPALMAWLDELEMTAPVLGNFLYADGGTNVRVAAAGQALARTVRARHTDATLGFLATPTDVFVAPQSAAEQSVAAFAGRAAWSKGIGAALGTVSGGRLLQPAYPAADGPQIVDSLVGIQGPNYALGKRIHRWQAVNELAAGRRVSMNVAPATRTRSVVKNKALAAAYAGAHHYGVTVFDPHTTRVLMATLLVHDLYAPQQEFAHPWELEAYQAAHGGLWRTAYQPRSALNLAAVLGAPKLLR